MIFEGTIKKVTHDKGNWQRIKFLCKGETTEIVAIGNIKGAKDGFTAKLEGEKVIDPTYGPQIKVTSSEIEEAKEKDGIIAYLASKCVKGIGMATAKKVYERFGNDSLDIVKNHPEKLLEIKGFSQKKVDMVIESQKDSDLPISVYKLLGGQITDYQVNKIIEHYGKNTVKVLETNPYQLIYDIDGIGFTKADKLAQACGISKHSKERVGAALVYVLQTLANSDGHCYSYLTTLEKLGISLLNPLSKEIINSIHAKNKFQDELFAISDKWEDNRNSFLTKYRVNEKYYDELDNWVSERMKYLDVFADSILDEVDNEHMVLDESEDDETKIYWSTLYNAEQFTGKVLGKLCRLKSVKKISKEKIENTIQLVEKEEGYELGSEQKDAIRVGARNRISIITGGPGRGKTTIIKTIADAWNDNDHLILCAPTGRAAQRMKESTGRNAETIHRKIMQEPPSKCLIIVDESSMIDIQLARRFLSWATEYDNNIIFVGDLDQLPSVGPGAFFRDIIQCGRIPTAKLKTCYRNSGSIAYNSDVINKGQSTKNFIIDKHFELVDVDNENIQETIINKYKELREKYIEKDICILSPSRPSSSGIDALNTIIREKYNPIKKSDPVLEGCFFRIGDRVMQTKNNAKKETFKDGVIQYGIFNGDCGKIIDIDIPNESFIIEFDDGRTAMFDTSEMTTFVLAYAMTIHKSQGSEYKAVILICSTQHFVMLKRNLLYTGETRAKDEISIIGTKKAVSMAIRDNTQKLRNTQLKEIIKENS